MKMYFAPTGFFDTDSQRHLAGYLTAEDMEALPKATLKSLVDQGHLEERDVPEGRDRGNELLAEAAEARAAQAAGQSSSGSSNSRHRKSTTTKAEE